MGAGQARVDERHVKKAVWLFPLYLLLINIFVLPIAFGGLLLLSGRFGDLIGRKSVFMVGLAVFTAASLVCGLSQSQEVLIGARFVQGVGGALTSGVILGIIVTMFPDPREQAKAIGVYSFVASAGASIGLLAGGLLTQGINWHWIFFVNLPIGVATALLAVRLVDRDAGIGLQRGADLLGAVLVTAALIVGACSGPGASSAPSAASQAPSTPAESPSDGASPSAAAADCAGTGAQAGAGFHGSSSPAL